MAVIASVFALPIAACSGGNTQGPSGGGTSSSGSNASSSGSNASSSGNASSNSGNHGTPADSGTGTQSACANLIGKWTATMDPGTTVTYEGLPLAVSGTIDFTLTHDDADLPNIVDFTGTAHITAQGQTYDGTLEPAKSPSGDPKDSTCDGALHVIGQSNAPIGVLDFTMDGTFDSAGTTGVGQFTMKSDSDNGATAKGTGSVHITRQK
jgi:hypothetical protein